MTNGSGIPVTGAIPIVMPTLTKIWKRKRDHDPTGDDRTERVARDRDHAQAAPDDQQVEAEQERRAEEAALLGERREDEVGVVLGQVVEPRLRRTLDAAPVEAARADGRDRLRLVVGGPGRILLEVGEVEPRRLVGLEHLDADRRQEPDDARREQRDDADEEREMAPADPGDEEAGDERGAVDERRAEVGLLEDERDRDRREPDRLQHHARLVHPADPVGEEARQREHEQQLPELGRLELERPDLDPALRAARGVGEREDEQHPDERQAVDPLLRTAVAVGVDRERDAGSRRSRARRRSPAGTT